MYDNVVAGTMTRHTKRRRLLAGVAVASSAASARFPGQATNRDGAIGEQYSLRTDGGREATVERESDTAGPQDYERWRQTVNLITQETRAKILQNVLGHPCMMPSLREVDYYNPSKSTGTLSEHLDKLVEANILMRVIIPQGERQGDLPNTFYTLTDEGYTLLERCSPFIDDLDQIRADHARVAKTDDVERYEKARRPTVDVDYPHPLQGDGRSVVDDPDCADWEAEQKEEEEKEIPA